MKQTAEKKREDYRKREEEAESGGTRVFGFPEGERHGQKGDNAEEIFTTNPDVAKNLALQFVPDAEFDNLTKMPILLIYGDNIRKEPSEVFNEEVWRVSLANARQFVDAVNRHGGDATLIYLPDMGIYGNTHAAFADTNNLEIADIMEKWLKNFKNIRKNPP